MGLCHSCCHGSGECRCEAHQARSKPVRNDREDPHAPLLTRKPDARATKAFDKDLDDFVQGLSSDDDVILDDEEIDALLTGKRD